MVKGQTKIMAANPPRLNLAVDRNDNPEHIFDYLLFETV